MGKVWPSWYLFISNLLREQAREVQAVSSPYSSILHISASYENVEKLAGMSYAPYKRYVAKYESYEEEALAAELNSIRLVRISYSFSLLFHTLFRSQMWNITYFCWREKQYSRNEVLKVIWIFILQDHSEIMDSVRLLANSVSKLFVAANKVRVF